MDQLKRKSRGNFFLEGGKWKLIINKWRMLPQILRLGIFCDGHLPKGQFLAIFVSEKYGGKYFTFQCFYIGPSLGLGITNFWKDKKNNLIIKSQLETHPYKNFHTYQALFCKIDISNKNAWSKFCTFVSLFYSTCSSWTNTMFLFLLLLSSYGSHVNAY